MVGLNQLGLQHAIEGYLIPAPKLPQIAGWQMHGLTYILYILVPNTCELTGNDSPIHKPDKSPSLDVNELADAAYDCLRLAQFRERDMPVSLERTSVENSRNSIQSCQFEKAPGRFQKAIQAHHETPIDDVSTQT
jgi:hypothetical protein